MKKIRSILNSALCFATAICLMAGCTNNEQQTAEDDLQAGITLEADNAEDITVSPEEDPEEYVSVAVQNTAEAMLPSGFIADNEFFEEAMKNGTFSLEFEVEGIKFAGDYYVNENDGMASMLYSLTGAKGTSAQIYALFAGNTSKLGTIGNSGTHIYSFDAENLAEKIASSIFAPDSGSMYAISESDYEMLLEYAAEIDSAIKGGSSNGAYSDYEGLINDFLEKYPPSTTENTETKINGETVSANIVQYDIPREGLRELAELLIDDALKQNENIVKQDGYTDEDIKAEMLSELDDLDDYSFQLIYYINSDTDQLMESDARLSWAEKPEPESNDEDGYDYVMSYNTNAKYDVSASIIYGADPASAEKQSVKIDFNIDYYDDDSYLSDTSGSLLADITKSENKSEVHITLTADGETMDLATITAEKNGDDYSVTAKIPEADITAGMTGTIAQDDNSFRMTIDRLFLTDGSAEMAYLPKAVITVKKGGELLDLDADKDFFDITEEEIGSLVENIEADFEAVFMEFAEDSAVGQEMMEYVEKSKLASANANAKLTYTAVATKLVMMVIDEEPLTDSVITGEAGSAVIDGKMVDLTEYVGESFSGHIYSEVDPENYTIKYAIWSEEPIPEEYRYQLARDEQEALAEDDIFIGCYPLYQDISF